MFLDTRVFTEARARRLCRYVTLGPAASMHRTPMTR